MLGLSSKHNLHRRHFVLSLPCLYIFSGKHDSKSAVSSPRSVNDYVTCSCHLFRLISFFFVTEKLATQFLFTLGIDVNAVVHWLLFCFCHRPTDPCPSSSLVLYCIGFVNISMSQITIGYLIARIAHEQLRWNLSIVLCCHLCLFSLFHTHTVNLMLPENLFQVELGSKRVNIKYSLSILYVLAPNAYIRFRINKHNYIHLFQYATDAAS